MTTPPPVSPEPSWTDVMRLPLGLLGAIVGNALGGWICQTAWNHAMLAIPVIGVATGFLALAFARKASLPLALIAAVVTLGGGVLIEGMVMYSNETLSFYFHNLGQIPGRDLLLHLLSVVVAGWICWGAPAKP